MERQLAAGLCVRGWLETSYYQLGADPGLGYMPAMGGWGILDYALKFLRSAKRLAAARVCFLFKFLVPGQSRAA